MEHKNPCVPSPCGPNAICQVKGEIPSCSCSPEFVGAPPNCRPECVGNDDCSSHLACINKKCRDPCPGSCASNAQCSVVSHAPRCSCPSGYTGNPVFQCILMEGKSRLLKKITKKSSNNYTNPFNRNKTRRTDLSMHTLSLWYERSMQRTKWRWFLLMFTRILRQSLWRLQTRMFDQLRLHL